MVPPASNGPPRTPRVASRPPGGHEVDMSKEFGGFLGRESQLAAGRREHVEHQVELLVGGWAYSEKYELVTWDDEIPNWMEK